MIIVKGEKEMASADLEAFENLARQWWSEQGYVVLPEGVVGKEAFTLEDKPESQKTVKWDELKIAPDGEWYWASPTNDARFVDWKEYLQEFGYTLQCQEVEKDFPDDQEVTDGSDH